jgi:hypothetical protein
MISDMAGVFVRAAHGTEYLFIFRRMVQGSKISKAKKTKIYLTTALISVLYIIPFCFTWADATYQLTGFRVSDELLTYTIFGTFIIRFTHYYMDAIMFKMSDPATRAAVGPLLTTNPDDVSMDSVVAATQNLAHTAVGPGQAPQHNKVASSQKEASAK